MMQSRVLRAAAVAVAGSVAGTVIFAGQSGQAGQSGPRPQDPSAKTYATYCAGCHGSSLSGGRAPTLLDDEWRFGGSDEQLRQRFPKWRNHLFVTGLGGEALRRLETDGDKVIQQEVVFSGYGRVRDIVTGPDGYLYVALNVPGVRLSDTTPGLIVRLVPAYQTNRKPTRATRGASSAAGRR